MSLDLYGRAYEGAPSPRLPSQVDAQEVAPNLRALITEIPGDAWTEFCALVNENHDMAILLAKQEILIARLRAGSSLYKECHEACVRALHYFDPASDF